MSPTISLLLFLASPFATEEYASHGQPTQPGPNVLLVVADDLGVDQLASYGEGTDPAITPTLDALASNGLLFRNAWSNPNCSPTRAGILTGRHGFRTGIGDAVPDGGEGLPLSETVLPEVLDMGGAGYATAAIGKWHLGMAPAQGGELAPNVAGFDHYDGALQGALQPPPEGTSYYRWPRVVNGVASWSNTYATTRNVDSALEWILDQSSPWFCLLAFNAPHSPFHAPPAGLYYEDLSGLSPAADPRPFYKAMIEALDTELGRLFAGMGPVLEDTVVVFVGDNGSPRAVTVPPFVRSQGKASVYEGGVNVPLIASGPNVPAGSECQALVNTVDLFATIGELAGVDVSAVVGAPLDSVSLVPYFADPARPSLRGFVYTERFRPIGAKGLMPLAHRAIRDERYKIVSKVFADEFYDLAADPFETQDLFQVGLSAEEQAAYDALRTTMLQLVLN